MDFNNNISVKKYMIDNNIELPSGIWIGDQIYFNEHTKQSIISRYAVHYWYSELDQYISTTTNIIPLKVIGKFKFSREESNPWWSKIEIVNRHGDVKSTYIVDDYVHKHIGIPSYKPRKINRTMESFTEFNNKLNEGFLNSNYKFASIMIKIENREELDEIKSIFMETFPSSVNSFH